MRNLKRLLSAALALVMSMSIASVASAVEFSDAADINYEEAVEVMSTIGVLEGFENGKFDPTSTLTREQAAKMIAYILLGSNYEKLATQTSRFKDVEPTRWSAPVIEYCAEVGIIAGNGDGTYAPTAELNGYAFAKMLLGALGYKAEIEGFTGAAWTLNVATYATKTGLDKGIENLDWSAPLSRETAAQMALNALKAPMVEYDNSTTVNIDGTTVTIGNSTAKYVVSEIANEQRISTTRLSNTNYYTVELGEQYFKSLRLSHDTDAFDRPSYTWTFETTEIGTYVDYTTKTAEYTTAISGETLYNLIGNNVIKEYNVTYYVDGKVDETIKASNMIKTNKYNYATTGNGVLTEVFVDHVTEEITITSINTYFAKSVADYNEKKGELTIDVSTTLNVDETLSVQDFPSIADVKSGADLIVKVAEVTSGQYEVVILGEPEIVSDAALTKYSALNYVVTGGEQYDYAKMGGSYNSARYGATELDTFNNSALDNTYNLYLDEYGYVLATKKVTGNAKYLFLTGYDRPQTHLGVKTAEAAAIFTDGEMKKIEVNVSATNDMITTQHGYIDLNNYTSSNKERMSRYNMWFSYSVDASGVYTLTPVANWLTVPYNTDRDTINPSSVVLRGTDGNKGAGTSNVAWGNDDSVYITVNTALNDYNDAIVSKVNGIYTGVQNVDIKTYKQATLDNDVIFALHNGNTVIAAVVYGEDVNNNKNFAYGIQDEAMNEYVKDADGYYYWDFTAVVGGEKKTLTVKSAYTSVIENLKGHIKTGEPGVGAMLELTYDKDGYVVDALVLSDDMKYNGVDETFIYGNDENTVSTEYTEDYKVYLVDVDGATTVSTNEAGNTMWLTTGAGIIDNGLAITAGAPIILVQEVWDETNTRYLTTEVEVYSNFNSVIKAFAPAGFKGQIGAALDASGRATYVVLNNEYHDGVKVDNGNGTTPDVDYSDVKIVNSDKGAFYASPKIQAPNSSWLPGPVFAALADQIRKDGFTVTKIEIKNANAVADATNTLTWKDQYNVEHTVYGNAIVRLYTVKVNDTVVAYRNGTNLYALNGVTTTTAAAISTSISGSGSGYSDNGTYVAYGTNSSVSVAASDYQILTGYYGLTVAVGDTVEYSLSDSPFSALADGSTHAVKVGATVYVRGNSALEKVSAGTSGVTVSAAPIAEPATALDKPVYTFTMTKDVTGNTLTAAAEWFTVTVGTGSYTDATNGTFTLFVPSATQIVNKTTGTATIKVVVTGTVSSTTAFDAKVTVDGAGSGTVVAGAGNVNTAAAPAFDGTSTGMIFTTGSTNGAVNGEFVITLSGLTKNVIATVATNP